MKQLFDEAELIGLTIKKAVYIDENKFFLIFEDSFCILRGICWGDPDIEIHQDKYNIKPDAYNCKDLEKLGFITEIEAKEIIKQYQLKNDALVRENELKKLAELKAKYENEQDSILY